MKPVSFVEIKLNSIKDELHLLIDPRKADTLYDAELSYLENGEAKYQLVEGCFYDYSFNDKNYKLGDIGENIVQPFKRNESMGTLAPNIFVGTLSIPVIDSTSSEQCGSVELEVQSGKSSYRQDYRDMLEFITEKCTDLLLQTDSPVSQNFEVDFSRNPQTLYQRFSFVKSIINSVEFIDAIHRVVVSPVTRWKEVDELKDIRNVRRFSGSNMREIANSSRRTQLPDNHYLASYGLTSIPEKINSVRKTDSVDTPENRFVKHVLETFLQFCNGINAIAGRDGYSKLLKESDDLINKLEGQLHHSFFNEISRLETLSLNSPVLQRKEGYREVLRVWLMFDLAAKLIWSGGEDVYSGGKKDVATLYEYWLFFVLLDLFKSIFRIDPVGISELIQPVKDGLNLSLKQGQFIPLSGVFDSGSRKLNIRFSYNRQFSGKKTYPGSGSWTKTLRPDYTLSVWPADLAEEDAEAEELIVHIHFDAKYKVDNQSGFLDQLDDENLDVEKVDQRKGIYKNADLLKMHAYKDAIRRTGGAYVLYPGTVRSQMKGFHEIFPGLGAFGISPSKDSSGLSDLRAFILEVVDHFINRTSQREKMALRLYDVYKNPPDETSKLKEILPEAYGVNRSLIPDDTYVLVGFYKDDAHLEWIIKKGLYNTRISDARGSINLGVGESSAKYLLLHTYGELVTSKLFKIKEGGPKIFSRTDLEKYGYKSQSETAYYLVYSLDRAVEAEFENVKWDIEKLPGYNPGRGSALPFSQTLAEVMRVVVKDKTR
jgi:predicted component of viral defense system (DUF524 family)